MRSIRKNPCLPADLARTLTGRARLRRASLVLRSGAVAAFALHPRGHTQVDLGAAERLGQVDLDALPQVGSGAGALAAAAPAHAEHLVENIAEVAGGGEIEAAHAGATAAVALLERRMAEAVVGAALLVVLQHIVGFVDFLEPRLGLLVAGIAIGVKLHGELAVRLLQVVRARVLRHTQRGVIILLGHLSPL